MNRDVAAALLAFWREAGMGKWFRGGADELVRRDQSARRVLPAQQRFAADDPVVGVELRLEVENELLFLDRAAQVDLECGARGDGRLHVRVEEA